MENLRHFVNVKTPSHCSSVFYNSPLPEELSQYYHTDCSGADKMKDDVLSGLTELQQIYADCSAYAEDLMYLCQSGLRVANGLAFLDTNSAMAADVSGTHEMAGHFVKIWNHLTVATKKLVSELEDGPLVALREVATTDKNEKSLLEHKKLLMTCFFAIIQIHFQFSFSMFESVVQLFASFPKDVILQLSESKSTTHDSVDLSTHLMTSWIESLTEMQKYLTNSLTNLNHVKFANDACRPIDVTGTHSNQHSRRRWSFGGIRQGCSSSDWAPKQWGISSGQQPDIDNIWFQDSHNVEESFKPPSFDSKLNFAEKKLGTFASNEELQDVISLLSCQPSNPSSPTSEIQHSLSGPANGGQNLLWSSSPQPVAHSTVFSVNSVESNPLTPDVDDYSSWSKNDDQPFGDLSLGLPPKLFDLTSMTGQGNLSLSTDNQVCKVGTSTNCPPSNPKRQNGDTNCANGVTQQIDVNIMSGARAKEQGFFLGLELVGTDLMASVRQRRHSSGESLCKNSRINSPSSSGRTKSIDNIMSDGKCARTSTWPLKQVSPQSSVFYIRNNDWKTTGQEQVTAANWSSLSEGPLGLPPSGIECRSKNKVERKYSLFGNPT